ncbi:acyl-CoA dehydrogenase (plasmid) [Streptomyces sp. NBC_01351]|uniref:acyl-CoA dehydrogenase n=1 Tax=Streptomyces sp. NBC_01351 TaxID=2903833 RepID=UPI002E2F9DE6|nr:acyl-CoA dehydrogenase [Streptomyces sp. NBC_01351]
MTTSLAPAGLPAGPSVGSPVGPPPATRPQLGAPEAAARAARLEALLGDPHDPANRHGIAALAGADARRLPPAATEELLASAGLGAEFVPAGDGGRLTRADLLAQVLRPVFRRDVALGFGYGITSLFASAPVWAEGTPQQRAELAGVLLGGGRASIVHHEMAHANGILRDEFTAEPGPGGYRLSGSKDVILNAARSQAYVVYARTAPARGPRSHSVFLVDSDAIADARATGRLTHLPRVTTHGMRGGLFSGLEFDGFPLPGHAMVGEEGQGVPLALRTFQVNRCLIPSVAVASADTVLHSAVRAVTEGRTASLARRWHKPLAGVFADLLAADSMATVSLRALSLLPAHVNVLAAAVKYVVPDLIRENLEELAGVLGGHGYVRGDAQYGALDKLVRDLPVAGLGHAGTAACQAVIVPQLRSLAERSWFRMPEPPPGLFGGGAALPALDYRQLGIAGGDDFLAATLVGAADRLGSALRFGGQMAALAELADGFVGELRELRTRCAALPAARATLAGPGVAVLADRYALILAAASVLGMWEAQDGTDAFLADPAWAVLALTRIGSRLGIAVPDLPEGCLAQVLDELIRRHRAGRSYDLDGTELVR